MKKKLLRSLVSLAFLLFVATHSQAQYDGMLGEIKLVGFNFAPRSWANCDGQLLSISQNSALFSLLGTTYGGDGRTTFALPDLRGRVPVGIGAVAGIGTINQGKTDNAMEITNSKNTGDTIKFLPGNIGMRYVICIAGMFPSRN